MKYYLFLLMLSVSVLTTRAQHAWRFESYNAMGVVASSQSANGLLQSVNGLSYGPWYAGLGLGMDFYRIRSVPVFLDLKYRWGKGKSQLIVYGDGGYSIPWDDMSDLPGGAGADTDFKGGAYWDAGLGVQRRIGKKSAIFFTLGYSEKNHAESYTIIPYCPGPGICEPRTEYADYRLKRYVVKVGWKF